MFPMRPASIIIVSIVVVFCIPDLTYALQESCSKYFEGFDLPENYNPNTPPDEKPFTITSKIIVREIVKVIINAYHSKTSNKTL